jgi:hypothetical protein
MKKNLLLVAFMAMSQIMTAQRATLVNDTARYMERSFAVGDTLLLGYGSKADKGFGFISMGSAMTGVTDLTKNWSKYEAVIEKVYTRGKTIYLRAKIIDKTVNLVGGNKLFIDLEGAIDNKELN